MNSRPTPILIALLRFFFFHFYRSLSWTYDLVAWVVSGGRWQKWVNSALAYVEGPIVLETGHGPGHLQVAMLQRGWRVLGIDTSRQMGQMAMRRINQVAFAHRSPGLARASGFAIPFPDRSFNSVVATFPTEYIIDRRSLAEFKRVLRPGGKLIVVLTAWIEDNRFPHRFFAWLFRFTGQAGEWDPAHTKPFIDAGFDIETHFVMVDASRVLILEVKKPPCGSSDLNHPTG